MTPHRNEDRQRPKPGARAARSLVFLVAGESSGDQLGAGLMRRLSQETGGTVEFAGVGGPRMEAEGLESLFPMSELGLMGLVEVLPHLPRLLRRIRQTEAAARKAEPDVFVTIDSPDFTLRVSRRLAGAGFPLVHYVAPSVWAWKPGRARRMAGYLDHVLALLPFEPPYFEREGLACSFVGHPAAVAHPDADRAGFRRAHGIEPRATVLCVLPGSRVSEVQRLLPIFGQTVQRLSQTAGDLAVVVPTLPHLSDRVRAAVGGWPVPVVVTEGEADKHDAFAASDLSLAASGTVAVELAAAGVPAVIGYRVNPLSAALVRRLVRVRYASLINLILDREVQPEFLQAACRPEPMARALAHLMSDAPDRRAHLDDCRVALAALRPDDMPPDLAAARAVLAVMDRNHRPGDPG